MFPSTGEGYVMKYFDLIGVVHFRKRPTKLKLLILLPYNATFLYSCVVDYSTRNNWIVYTAVFFWKASCMLTINSVIMGTVFWHHTDFVGMVRLIDTNLRILKVCIRRRKILFVVMMAMLVHLLYTLTDYLLWYNDSGATIWAAVNEYSNTFYFLNLNLIKVIAVNFIRTRLICLRKALEKIFVDEEENFDAALKVDYIIKTYIKVCDAFDDFVKIFGWNLMFTVIIAVLSLLTGIISLLFAEGGDPKARIALCLWIINITIQSLFVVVLCEKTTDEHNKFKVISYRVLQNSNEELYHCVFGLTQQVSAKVFKFSAAGFFNIDFRMIFTFSNIIISYVTIIVQFKKGLF